MVRNVLHICILKASPFVYKTAVVLKPDRQGDAQTKHDRRHWV